MIRMLLGIILLIMLTACGTLKPTDTQTVYVPVVTKCRPLTGITEVQELPFDKAKKEMSLFEKSQLLAAENKILKGQNVELKAALTECTK